MNVEWKSEIDMLKAYPIAIHDSSIYRDGRLDRGSHTHVSVHCVFSVFSKVTNVVILRIPFWQLLF